MVHSVSRDESDSRLRHTRADLTYVCVSLVRGAAVWKKNQQQQHQRPNLRRQKIRSQKPRRLIGSSGTSISPPRLCATRSTALATRPCSGRFAISSCASGRSAAAGTLTSPSKFSTGGNADNG